jgi:hypothetical protein
VWVWVWVWVGGCGWVGVGGWIGVYLIFLVLHHSHSATTSLHHLLTHSSELVEHRTVSQNLASVTGVSEWIARCARAKQLHAHDTVEDPESHATVKKCELHQKYR